jgi:hypothetical protein
VLQPDGQTNGRTTALNQIPEDSEKFTKRISNNYNSNFQSAQKNEHLCFIFARRTKIFTDPENYELNPKTWVTELNKLQNFTEIFHFSMLPKCIYPGKCWSRPNYQAL